MDTLDEFLFLRSHLTAWRERLEDPERELYQWICDQEEELECLRHLVAAVMTDESSLRQVLDRAVADEAEWRLRAADARERRDLDSLERCESEAAFASERAAGLRAELERLSQEGSRLQTSFRDLESTLRQARHRRTLLVARMARAPMSDRYHRALDRATEDSSSVEFARFERDVERAEALNSAYDRLSRRPSEAGAARSGIDNDERRRRLEAELDALQRRTGDIDSAGG
ncbi:MAG: PspA/IM30 family protein [Planctomycetaceae bacterium]|nr:PspA/IM30 family protein [Planctomycetaceae bacterium]